MHIVTRSAATRRGFVRHGMLEQVRDLGQRLEHLMARYDRLVRDMAGADVPSPDFESRAQSVNVEIGSVAYRLQDLFVLEYEARKAEAYAAFQAPAPARTPAKTAVCTTRRTRRGSFEPMSPGVEAEPLRQLVAAGGF